jgi:predicted transposase/invertase (TIGR01784 family)
MANQISPHDKLFKITMSQPKAAKEFLQKYLPTNIKELTNNETLQIHKESFIDEHLKGHIADLLYSVSFNNKPGYIYILFEHLSNPDKMIAFRILKYIVNIMQFHLQKEQTTTLPIVYPIILYSGHSTKIATTDLFDLFDNRTMAESILWNPYYLLNLQDINDEDLKEQMVFGLMVKIFNHRYKPLLEVLEHILPNIQIIDREGNIFLLNSVLKYLFETSDIDENTLFDALLPHLSEQTGEYMMTTADRLRQEGRQEGWQEGKQETINFVVKNLLKEHESIDKISKITGLSKQQIEQLQKKK